MAKKIILASVIAIIMIVFAMLFLINDTVDIYNDGENVSVETHTISDIDVNPYLCPTWLIFPLKAEKMNMPMTAPIG